MIATLWFAAPGFLWLLPVAVAPLLLARRSLAAAPKGRRNVAAVLQTLALAAGVLALARPWWDAIPAAVARIAVVEPTAEAAALQAVQNAVQRWRAATPHGDPFFVVTAAARPVAGTRGDPRLPAGAGGPDLAAALTRAIDLVPVDHPGEIVLWGPGEDATLHGANRRLREAARRAAARGIALHWRRLPPPERPPRLLSVSHPAAVDEGAAVPWTVTLASDRPGDAVLMVSTRDQELARQPIALPGGTSRHTLTVVLPGRGQWEVRTVLEAAGAEPEGATERSAVHVGPGPRVLYLGTGFQPLADALRAQGIDVRAADPGDALSAGDLYSRDAVLIDDLPADRLPVESQAALAAAVQEQGTGLLLAGAHANLGPGGWAGTPLAPLLPVTMPQREERRDPSVALVLILDTSGSMGGSRVELAKEVARLALRRLQPHDKAGIVEFYGSKRWAAPLQPAANTIELMRALNRLQAGGGTIIFSALEEAYYALLNVRTRFKHILVLTDGGVESGPFEALARRMADSGMNLSTVLIGPQGNSPFLMDLANWGRGRFYACPSRFQLPDLRFKEPQTTPLPTVQEGILPIDRSLPAEATGALDDSGLAVAGTVEARVRDGAELLLTAGPERPLLSAWDQGLGRVAVWTSETSGDLVRALRADPRYATFLADLLRSLARPRQALRPRLRVEPASIGPRVELSAPGAPPYPLPVLVVEDRELEVSMLPGGTARFVAELTWPDDRPLLLEARVGGATVRAAAARPLPATTRPTALDDGLHRAVRSTGGSVVPLAEGPPVTDAEPRIAPRAVTHLFALAALLLYLLAILTRRWPEHVRGAALGVSIVCLAPVLPSQQEPEVIQARIRQELAAHGHLERLAEEWREGTWHQRYALARARGDLGSALAVLEEATADTRPERALLLEALGRTEDALETVRLILAGETLAPAERAQWRQREGELLLTLADDPSGTEQGGAALRAAASAYDEPAQYALGHLAAGYGRYALALELHTAAVLGSKAALATHLRRATWQEALANVDDAAGELVAAYGHARSRRDRAFVLSQRTALMRRADRLPELAAEWLRDPDGLDMPQRSALLDVLRELGRGEEALALLRRLEDPALQQQALSVAVETGRGEEAAEHGRALLEADPDNARLRVTVCVLLSDLHRREAAAAVLSEGYSRADRKPLLLLVQAASDLALDGAFREGLERLRSGGGERDRLQALLLQCRHLQRGRREREAVDLMLGAREQFEEPEQRVRIAEALESAGRTAEATELYAAAHESHPTEDLALRLAWLLSRNRDKEERKRAEELFREVWLSAGSPARRVQAEERVLDIAARGGTLADLAIELEEALEDPATGHRDAKRQALVKIYSRAQDSLTAATILRAWADDEPARAVEAWSQLARVYLENEEFRNQEKALRRLIELDPDHELDYRQQLALSALERGRPAEARAVIREMLADGAPDAVAYEFAAGVYTLAGRFRDAARVYRRSLALHPDRIETLLLWGNAMAAMDERERAVGLFSDLLLQDVEDDLFLVAADGLLNLGADAPALQFAVRATRRRLAVRPEKVYLHRLLQDLLESLGDEKARIASLRETILVAGEQRTTWLRELMQEAQSRRDWAAFVEHGRALLATGDEVPPAVFLELGEALLQQEQLRAAERAFARARLSPDFAQVERRVAELYEASGHLEDAERVRRRILRRDPDNPEAIVAVALLTERRGRGAQALELYVDAARRMFESADLAGRPTVQRGRNRSEQGLDWNEALEGVLRTAREPAQLEPVRNAILTRLGDDPPADGAGWLRALGPLARLALAWNGSDALRELRELEDRALEQHGDDAKTRREILLARLARGDLAAAFDVAAEGEEYDVERLRLLLLRGAGEEARLLAAKAEADDLFEALRLLHLAGDAEGARTVLGKLAELATQELAEYGHHLLQARALLGLETDPGPLRDARLEKALTEEHDDPRRRVRAVLAALVSHDDLSEEARARHLRDLLADVQEAKDANLTASYLREARKVLAPESLAGLVASLFDELDRAYYLSQRAVFLDLVPEERAIEILDRGLRQISEGERRQQLLLMLSASRLPIRLLLAVVERLDLGQLAPADRHRFTRLCLSADLPDEVGRSFLDKARAQQPREPGVAVLAARLADGPEARRRELYRAVELLRAEPTVDSHGQQVLDEVAKLADDVATFELSQREGEDQVERLLRAALWKKGGELERAADVLAEVYRADPDDVIRLNQLQALLLRLGRKRDALEAYETYVDRAARVYPYQAGQLARLYLELGEGEQAVAALRKADDPHGANLRLRLLAATQCRDPEVRAAEARAWLQEHQRLGRSGNVRVVFPAPSRADEKATFEQALSEFEVPAAVRLEEREALPSEYDLLALLPEGTELAEILLRALPVAARRDSIGLYRGLLGSARQRGPGAAEALLEQAQSRLRQNPDDPEALRLVYAGAQLGMDVSAEELRRAVLRILLHPGVDRGELVEAALTLHARGESDTTSRLLSHIADRASLNHYTLRTRLPGILALLEKERADALLGLMPGSENATPYLDGLLMILLAEAEGVTAAAVLEGFARVPDQLAERSPYHDGMVLALPYAGLCLRAGRWDAAVQVLEVDDPSLEYRDDFVPQALAAAIPPVEEWGEGVALAAVHAFLLREASRGAEGRRFLFLRLGCMLAHRLRQAGRTDDAKTLLEDLEAAAGTLPGAPVWLRAVAE